MAIRSGVVPVEDEFDELAPVAPQAPAERSLEVAAAAEAAAIAEADKVLRAISLALTAKR